MTEVIEQFKCKDCEHYFGLRYGPLFTDMARGCSVGVPPVIRGREDCPQFEPMHLKIGRSEKEAEK